MSSNKAFILSHSVSSKLQEQPLYGFIKNLFNTFILPTGLSHLRTSYNDFIIRFELK
jgi:hypothetical protein